MITAVLIPLNFLVYQLIAFIEGTTQDLDAVLEVYCQNCRSRCCCKSTICSEKIRTNIIKCTFKKCFISLGFPICIISVAWALSRRNNLRKSTDIPTNFGAGEVKMTMLTTGV